MQIRMIRKRPILYRGKIQNYKLKKIRNNDESRESIRNSVLEGSNLKWYNGLMRDVQQGMNYR